MSGFVGFLNNNMTDETEEIIKAMTDKIIHRGPDGEGYYTDSNTAIGFRSLNIIDSNNITYPIYNENKNLIIVFDGRIYNTKELKKSLEKKGHIFLSADYSESIGSMEAEVILHGYEEYGENIASMLRGMFSFAIYDVETGKLYGARDNFGIKPFYYYLNSPESGKPFIFGSEIKSFMPHPDFDKEINKNALKMYLIFQYSVLPETFFKNVYKLPQGCYFTYTYADNKFTLSRYFDIEYTTVKEEEEKSFDEYMEILGETVKSSVECHLKDNTEIGGFLSGGVDSSYITSIAKPAKTFSVGFDKQGFDESMYAKELSDILKIENHKKIVSPDEFFEVLPKVQYHSDEPHANLSAIPLYYLSEMAAKSVKVALSGEGPDELFAGYLVYEETKSLAFYRRIPYGIRKAIGAVAGKLPNFKGRLTLVREGKKVEDYHIGQAFIMTDGEANDILSKTYKNSMTYKDVTAPYYEKVKDKNDLIKKLYLDMHLWLPNDIFLKADKMTAAHSLEVRAPFMDKTVFEFASKIPVKYFVKGKTTKYIFREAANKVIPPEWAKRKKLGFPVPFTLWLREEKYASILRDMFGEDFAADFFDREKLYALLDEHINGVKNNGRKLYTVYSFLLWYKIYFLTA